MIEVPTWEEIKEGSMKDSVREELESLFSQHEYFQEIVDIILSEPCLKLIIASGKIGVEGHHEGRSILNE